MRDCIALAAPSQFGGWREEFVLLRNELILEVHEEQTKTVLNEHIASAIFGYPEYTESRGGL